MVLKERCSHCGGALERKKFGARDEMEVWEGNRCIMCGRIFERVIEMNKARQRWERRHHQNGGRSCQK